MKHPFQILITDKSGEHLFASVKNNLLVFNLQSGDVVGSWVDDVDISAPLKKQQEEKIKVLKEQQAQKSSESPENDEEENPSKKVKSNNGEIKIPKIPVPGPGAPPIYNYIRSLTLSRNENYLIGTTDSDKAAVLFSIDYKRDNCLQLVKRQVFPKRPCAVSSTPDDSTLVVADKFGDVYSIPIDNAEPVDEKELVPILGHVSMLSDVLVTEFNGKQFVLTGDRDEHIRITNYPRSYVVKSWLFGHREFVSTLHIPQFDPSLLISAGGDDYLVLWKWLDNKLLTKVELREYMQPFLNDSHFPPERFLTEDSPKEISISRVLSLIHPSTNSKLIIILCENTNCILTFELDETNYTVTHKQTFETKHSIVDITLNGDNILASLDIESDDQLIELYTFNENAELTDNSEEKSPLLRQMTIANPCVVGSKADFYPLYSMKTLRKRSEH